jgi:hypothetical protein
MILFCATDLAAALVLDYHEIVILGDVFLKKSKSTARVMSTRKMVLVGPLGAYFHDRIVHYYVSNPCRR